MYDGWVCTVDEKERAELLWDQLWLEEFVGIQIGDEVNLPADWETQVRAGTTDGGIFNEMPDPLDEHEWWLARTDEETERLHKTIERVSTAWQQYQTSVVDSNTDGTSLGWTPSKAQRNLYGMGGQILVD